MKQDSLERQSAAFEVSVYECEIHLKFRLIEEKGALSDRDQLLEQLIDAFTCGTDEYLEQLQVLVKAEEVSEMSASPELRRQLIRLRNSNELA